MLKDNKDNSWPWYVLFPLIPPNILLPFSPPGSLRSGWLPWSFPAIACFFFLGSVHLALISPPFCSPLHPQCLTQFQAHSRHSVNWGELARCDKGVVQTLGAQRRGRTDGDQKSQRELIEEVTFGMLLYGRKMFGWAERMGKGGVGIMVESRFSGREQSAKCRRERGSGQQGKSPLFRPGLALNVHFSF